MPIDLSPKISLPIFLHLSRYWLTYFSWFLVYYLNTTVNNKVLDCLRMTGYKLLGLLTLQRNMLLCFIDTEQCESTTYGNDLVKIQYDIDGLNNDGIVERRHAERRARGAMGAIEKRVQDRRIMHEQFAL